MIEEQVLTQPAPQAPAAVEAPRAESAPAPAQGKTEPKKAWMKQLEGDLWSNDLLAEYDSFSGPARKLLEYEGKKERLVEIPAPDAPDDVKAQFRTKLGVPAKPEDYKFKAPELPKELNLKWDPKLEEGFRKKAHEIGLNDSQFNELMTLDTNSKIASIQARNAAQKAFQDAYAKTSESHLSAIKTEWGPKFNENSAKAMDAMTRVATPDMLKLMEDARLPDGTPFMKHPLAAKMFFDLSGVVGEGEFIRGGIASAPQVVSLLSKEERAQLQREGIKIR